MYFFRSLKVDLVLANSADSNVVQHDESIYYTIYLPSLFAYNKTAFSHDVAHVINLSTYTVQRLNTEKTCRYKHHNN